MSSQKAEVFQQIDLQKSGIIEASAGTGKTYTLVNLIIRILVDESLKQKYGSYVSLKEILVVTFTEKATQELLQRIYKEVVFTVEKLKKKKKSNKELVEHLENCLVDFEQVNIQTLHGFCYQVVKKYGIHMKVEQNSELLNDQQEMVEEEFSKIFPQYFSKWNFAQEYDSKKVSAWRKNLLTIIQKFRLENNDSMLSQPELMIALHGENSKKSLKQEIIHKISDVKQKLETKNMYQAFKNLKEEKWNNLAGRQINKHRLDKLLLLTSFVQQSVKETTQSELNVSWIQEQCKIDKNFLMMLTDFSQFVQTIFNFENQNVSSEEVLFELGKRINLNVIAMINLLCEIMLWTELYLYHLENKDLSYDLTEMAKKIHQRIALQKRKKSMITYDDMISFVVNIFKQKKSYVLASLKKRFRVGMVDEFQDTNVAQWFLCRSLFLNEQNQLYIVGDPKQSIYSFQGGNLQVYFEAKREIEKIGKVYTLNKNYRSQKNLVEGCNLFFDSFIQKNDEIQYTQIKSKDETESDPSIWAYEYQGSQEKFKTVWKEHIAKVIRNDLKEFKLRDICVLARTNDELLAIGSHLEENKIPHFHYKKRGVFQSTVCYDVKILMKAIENPLDLANLKILVTSRFFKKSLTLADEIDLNSSFFKNIWYAHQLYKSRYWKKLLQWMQSLGSHFDAKLETDQKGLKQIFRLLHQCVLQKNQTWQEVIYFLEQVYAEKIVIEEENRYLSNVQENKVQLMTMHASKGLEFSVVIISDLEKSFQKEKTCVIEETNGRKNFIFPELRTNKIPGLYQEYQKAKVFQEHIRLCYVTLTRAKEKLVIPFCFSEKSIQFNEESLLKLTKKENRFNRLWVLLREKKHFKHIVFDDCTNKVNDFSGNVKVNQKQKMLKENDFLENESFKYIQKNRLQQQISYSRLQFDEIPKTEEELKKQRETIDPFIENELNDLGVLPSSAQMGNMLHSLLERLDFSQMSMEFSLFQKEEFIQQLILQTLEEYHLRVDLLLIQKLLWNTFHTKLIDPFTQKKLFALKDITEYLPEMSFCFSFNQQGDSFIKEYFPHFMIGFADLVFCFENRYYVLDWKSNWLPQYSKEEITKSMLDHHYDKQELIYSAVLHHWLKENVSDYHYEIHFGGSFYVYLRGMMPNKEQGYRGYRYSLVQIQQQLKKILQYQLQLDKKK